MTETAKEINNQEETKEQEAAALTVRPLNNTDFWALINMIRKGGKQAFAAMKEADNADDNTARGMVIFEVGMEYAEKEMQQLFARLVDMTPEQFAEAPFDTTLTIIESLTEQNDLGNFIKRAAAVIKKFSKDKK